MIETKSYTPELLPRQGELNAWLLAFAAFAGIYILSLRAAIPYWAWFLFGLLAFSALSISLGNWMDRRTRIVIEAAGVSYNNGLRKTNLAWNSILEVRVAPARWGTSVQVIGQQSHFSFSTLGEMEFQGKSRGRTGFVAGKEILDEILRSAGLIKSTRNGPFLTYSRP
jgi:hypothetical protein